MPKILVTGGAGFIGSHLVERLLNEGNQVVCMDNLFTSTRSNIAQLLNSGLEFWRHDVCDPWHIECDQIYHLACPASPIQYQRNPVRTIKTAFLGTLNALQCARDVGARLLIASTSEIYGDPEVHPQVESYFGNVNTLGPRSCYDEGKRAGESLAYSWAMQYGTDVRIARIFNTYGPKLAINDGRVISNFICQAIRGENLTVYGDGLQTRSLCYVSDTVLGLMKLMDIGNQDHFDTVPVVNLGNPEEHTVLDIAQDIIKVVSCGKKLNVVFEPLPQDDPKQRKPDISKAIRMLGWKPEVSYARGIEYTINWFETKFRTEALLRGEEL